jgi:hypothetical protein
MSLAPSERRTRGAGRSPCTPGGTLGTTPRIPLRQPGHNGQAPKRALDDISKGKSLYPGKIIINAEPPYEAHGGTNLADVQRYSFWSSMLTGYGGFTYGAAGIFQANDRDRPTGRRPDGGAYDSIFWDDGIKLIGAEHLARGNALLKELGVEQFETHPEWATSVLRFDPDAYPWPVHAFAAGIPNKVRVIYVPLRFHHWEGPLVHAIEPGVRYKAAYVETDTMRRHELGVISGDGNGAWQAPTLPHMFDWLLVLEAV